MKKNILIYFLSFLIFTNCGYNRIQELDEDANAGMAEILNQYKRRTDLIPSLMKVVEAYAKHEKSVLVEVTKARGNVGSIQATPETLNDPALFSKFQNAQNSLGSALQRLLVVVEKYPDLKANDNFRDLQSQLEGTENRIAVARTRFIKSVQAYNTFIRKFPYLITAKIFGYKTKPSFKVENEKEITDLPDSISKPPEIKFE
ncbi:MAG: LemA family protein [Leptospiraceae bacterium]|nr:LemA family protein [Leptospiraceae bacterium]MCK6380079.1 LemA family protein [Leptospiraceae bacterium]NUM40480.1 LemA family protein [Leptospiraceae bacterium]